jgi:serine protease Do
MEQSGSPVLKYVAWMVCIAALMLASGYWGMRIASYNTAKAAQDVPAGVLIDSILVNIPTAGGDNLTLADLFEGANPAVVAISTQSTGRNVFGQTVTRPTAGSGFFVSPNGYIVTNDHVIENARNINVLKYDGTVHTATLVGRDPSSDVAVIKIDANNHSYLTFGDSDALRVGYHVAAIGNPLGELANSMTVGVISALNRSVIIDGTTRTKIQTDAAVNRGNSGGPLLNLRGEVIGVINAKSVGDNVEGLGFAIPANQAKAVAEQLIEYGFVRGRAIMGITINEIQDNTGNRMVRINALSNGGPAEKAGIQVGDILLYINGIPIPTFSELRAVMDSLSPNDITEVRIRRGTEEKSFTVVLDEYKPAGV